MELWGADRYGDPCRECGFGWGLSVTEVLGVVEALPGGFSRVLAGRRGDERHPDLGWTAAGYVSHVADNLRNWSERLAGARLSGAVRVAGYDPDLLARARGYDAVSAGAALWSLERAATGWVESVSAAVEAGVVLQHVVRGPQRAEDVARNNAHDGTHHLWDVRRILSFTE